MMKAIAILLSLISISTGSQLKYSKDVVIDGSLQDKELRDTVIQFRVSTTNDKGQEWTCLRLEFNLQILSNTGEKYNSSFVTNTTTINEISNCSQLVLNFENSTDSIINLQFEQQQSEKETEDVQIFYMKKASINQIPIPGFAEPLNSDFEFVPESQKMPKFSNDTIPVQTPVELEIHNSFKCYRGFNMIGNATNANHVSLNRTAELIFTKFKLEMYESYEKKATDMNMKSPWKRIYSCDADISKTLPIIVGCALGAIVFFTLIGYIIAKKRSTHAYEEL